MIIVIINNPKMNKLNIILIFQLSILIIRQIYLLRNNSGISMEHNNSSSQGQIKKLIAQRFQGYSQDKIQITLLTGLTNDTFKVSCQGKQSLIFRRFSAVFNRNVENKIFKVLEQAKIAPKCYYACQKYRIEHFIQNGVHPSLSQLKEPKIRQSVFQMMYKYHQNKIHIPQIQNKPLFIQKILSQRRIQKIRIHKQDSPDNKFQKLLTQIESQYQKLSQLQAILIQTNPQQAKKKTRFCHNDLNSLNIFIQPQLTFIDYEYSSYNYFYYDIANFMNQSTINYGFKQFPYFQVQKMLTLQDIQESAKLYPDNYPGLQKDILKGLIACNLYWAGWSIIMANDPAQGSFGTVQHGIARMNLYRHYKGLL